MLVRGAAVTSVRVPAPLAVPGSSVSSGGSLGSGGSRPGVYGTPETVSGYADGTASLSWEELGSHTLAPGVLIRLRESLPVSASAPTEVAHKVVLIFGRWADARQPGSAGPYLIQSVVYDGTTDTYFVKLG